MSLSIFSSAPAGSPSPDSPFKGKRVAILFNSFGPYHKARIDALGRRLRKSGAQLYAVRFSETSKTYAWSPCEPTEAKTITLLNRPMAGNRDLLLLLVRWIRFLYEKRIEIVFLPSYSPLPNTLCYLISRTIALRCILMSDSWEKTQKAGTIGRWIKSALVNGFHSGLVAGTPQRQHYSALGLDALRIFPGYDVVDNEYFSAQRAYYRTTGRAWKERMQLPDRFFLNIGRMVPKKNLRTLIQAFAVMTREAPELNYHLVLVGSGPEKEALKKLCEASSIPFCTGGAPLPSNQASHVFFYDFQQVDKTPLFFSFASAFVLPSTCEEWGLVVNEAMACSLPVVVSHDAGCCRDLVRSGKNGFCFDPGNPFDLKDKLYSLASDTALASAMGQRAKEEIDNWSLDRFSNGAVKALHASLHLTSHEASLSY